MLTDKQIKHMVDRFLGWRLPKNFSPDAGISFKAAYNEGTAHPMSAASEKREIAIIGTGHPAPADGRYIGTASLSGGALMFHVFEGKAVLQ